MKIEEIRHLLEQVPVEELEHAMEPFALDRRKTVQKLLETFRKKKSVYEAELLRTERMKRYEKQYDQYEWICGIDEAGRGPLAGPVVAAAVILPKDCDLLYINDSKQVPEKKREELYDQIRETAISVGVGIVSPKTIDEINILQATYEAMREAIRQLEPEPSLLLNDAVKISDVGIPQVPIIKGDAKSISIAAASIIAKVTRDRMMREYDQIFPEYGFAGHKGYGSASHIKAIKTFGPCPIHRKTFLKNLSLEGMPKEEEQIPD